MRTRPSKKSCVRNCVWGICFFLAFGAGSVGADSEKKETEAQGPKVISDSIVPLPPYYYEGAQEMAGGDTEAVNQQESEEVSGLKDCVQYDDSICGAKCNPPVQDVGERCAQYDKRPDGVCVCKLCEKVDCGGG